MIPVKFPEQTCTYAENQKEYQPLPAHRIHDKQGTVISCWQLTWRERVRLLFTGKLWLQQLTFHQPLQPQLPTVDKPAMATYRPGNVPAVPAPPPPSGK